MKVEKILWKRSLTADEVNMKLSHSQVVASHSAIHRPKHKIIVSNKNKISA